MKLTKTQLKEIIREEIYSLKSKTPSMRLNSIVESWILDEDSDTVLNPETGRTIKVSTALSYPEDHPAHKAVKKVQSKKSGKSAAISVGKSSSNKPMSSKDKNDKVFSKLVDNSGYLDGDAIETMSPKSRQKVAKLAQTRVKLYDKLDTIQKNETDDIASSYEDYGGSPKANSDGGFDIETPNGVVKFTKEQSDYYYNEKYNFQKKQDRELGNATDVAFNVKWSEKNPKLSVVDAETSEKVKSKLKKVESLKQKRESLLPKGGSYRTLKDLSDID
jgi:uncharacterized protein YdcH (DUF465 family)